MCSTSRPDMCGQGQKFVQPEIYEYSHEEIFLYQTKLEQISSDWKFKLAGFGRQCVLIEVAALDVYKIFVNIFNCDGSKPEVVMFKRCFCTHSL